MSRNGLGSVVAQAVLLLAVVLTGCGDSGDPGGPGAAADSPGNALEGRTFVATSVDDPARRVVRGTTIRLVFSDGDVAVDAGCNHLSGRAGVEADRLVVTAMGGTEMGCEPRLAAQDAWLSEFLTSRPRLATEGGSVTLTGDRTTIRLEEQQDVDASLQGARWRLDSLVEGDGPDATVSSVPDVASRTTLVVRDGRITVDTGCNVISAPVRVGPAVLRADRAPVTTLRGCAPGLSRVEDLVVRMLEQGAAYVVRGSSLVLTSRDGSRGLGFVAP